MQTGKLIVALASWGIVAQCSAQALAAEDGESPTDVLAARLRAQGIVCAKPSSAVRDAAASRPNDTVWVLTCEDATYRIRLVPDMAAGVERIGGESGQKRP